MNVPIRNTKAVRHIAHVGGAVTGVCGCCGTTGMLLGSIVGAAVRGDSESLSQFGLPNTCDPVGLGRNG